MSPRHNVTAERIAQILAAASQVFAERGFDAARMDEVAAAASLSKATLYLYFKNKEALISALGEEIFRRELADYHALAVQPGPARARLLALVQAVTADQQQLRALLPMIYEFFALGLRQPAARQVLEQYLHQSLEILAGVVQAGIDQGEFRPVDARQTAAAIGALMDGTALWWGYDTQPHNDVETQIKFGLNLLLEALRPEN